MALAHCEAGAATPASTLRRRNLPRNATFPGRAAFVDATPRGTPVKISYVHGGPIPGVTANTVNVAKMCSAFASLGHSVALLAPGQRCAGDFEAIRTHYSLDAEFAVVRLGALATRIGPLGMLSAAHCTVRGVDLVYTRLERIAYMCARVGLPTVLEIHSPVRAPAERSAMEALVKLRSLRGIVCISSALKEQIAADFGVDGDIVVAHDGADPLKDVSSADKQLGARLRVGYTGHLYAGKGMEIIVPLAELCPWADFVVVGGLDDDVKRWRRQASGASNVEFVGAKPHSEVRQYVSGFDVVLAPYLRTVVVGENPHNVSQWMSPLKVFEYMAAGKPIVCSDLPVLREVLTHQETSLMCNPDKLGEWRDALERLRSDIGLRLRLGADARKIFLNNYTWRRRAERILTHVTGLTAVRAA